MYIPMWHMWSSNLFYAILYFWQMKCQWWKIVWIRCETLVKYWRIDYWRLRDILATDLRHEFEPDESHSDRLIQFRTPVRHLKQQRKAKKIPSLQRWGHTLLHSFTLRCHRFIRKPFLIFRWDPVHGGTMSKNQSNTVPCWITFWKVPIIIAAENGKGNECHM